MCASALRQLKIRAVYYGCSNDRFGVLVVSCPSILSMLVKLHAKGAVDDWNSPNIDPPYPANGGIYREEAIMLLRRFYVQENEKGEE